VENFDSPYYAQSVAEFWRRWHMSFTHWILDYIFRPLQIELRNWRTWGTPVSLLVTFLISGLWHGASWCFVVWGGLHGVYMATSVLSSRWRRKLLGYLGLERSPCLRVIEVLVTFHLVCLAWVFFRATTLRDAVYVLHASATGLPASLALLLRGTSLDRLLWLGRSPGECLMAVALVVFMAVAGACRRRLADRDRAPSLPALVAASPWIRTTVSAVMFYLLAFHGASARSFIYVQF